MGEEGDYTSSLISMFRVRVRIMEARDISNLQKPTNAHTLGTHSAIEGSAEADNSKVVLNIRTEDMVVEQLSEYLAFPC